jgi:hypothetical protein
MAKRRRKTLMVCDACQIDIRNEKSSHALTG